MALTKSSKQWLQERAHDPYVKAAKDKGYRARSAFKLLEIQEKHKLLKSGATVVELGAAPGGWSQVARPLLGEKGRLIAIDLLAMAPLPGVEYIQGDCQDEAIQQQIATLLNGEKIKVVLSDMAPNMSGMDAIDAPQSIWLAEVAFSFCSDHLKKDGTFLVKVFQGEGFDEYLKLLRQHFKKVVSCKPKASRDRSSEMYLLGLGYKNH
jgi:23S rRNA (uridine2552-2'-O)-methyltransferase